VKSQKRQIAKWLTSTVFVVLIIMAVIGIGSQVRSVFTRRLDATSLRTEILCHGDHRALWDACQELAQQVRSGKLKSGLYSVRSDADPVVSQFPAVLQALRPASILIENDGRVTVEMFGGTTHFGVRAYASDFKKPFPEFKCGDRELVPNLWYYDDGYRHNPDFDKVVSTLMAEKGQTQRR